MPRLSMKEFRGVVRRVMETLPDEIKQHLDQVSVEVEDAPDMETLREAGFTDEEIEAGDTLYGLFVPMPLPSDWSGDVVDAADLPHRIFIYKQPLEEDFPERRKLILEIRKTVIHELAHHFDYSERDLERFEAQEDPFGDAFEDQL